MMKNMFKDYENVKLIKKNSDIKKSSNSNIEPFSNWKLINSKIEIGKNVKFKSFQNINLKNAVLIIGNNVDIGSNVSINLTGENKKKVTVYIGNLVRIDDYCHLECYGDLFIGNKCHLWAGVYIGPFDKPYRIEDRVTIGQKSILSGRGPLTIKKYTMIGGLSSIITENHNYLSLNRIIRNQGFKAKGIFIGEDVWIGASTIILDDSYIDKKTVIGAGSLVKGRTVKGSVYYGVPIRKSVRLKRI